MTYYTLSESEYSGSKKRRILNPGHAVNRIYVHVIDYITKY